jgi:hypothetical protein
MIELRMAVVSQSVSTHIKGEKMIEPDKKVEAAQHADVSTTESQKYPVCKGI